MEAEKINTSLQWRRLPHDDEHQDILYKLNTLLEAGETEQAKQWLEHEIKADQSNNDFLYCQLGVVQCMLDELQLAESSFLRAIEINDHTIEAHFNLGMLYQNRKMYQNALTYYKKVVIDNKNDTETLELMGECCLELANYHDAIAFYDAALKQNPKSLNAAVNLARLYLQKDDHQQAIQVLKIALVTFPQQTELHFALGDIYKSIDEYEHAIGHFRKVVAIETENAQAFFELGYCCMQLSLTNQAIPLLAKAYKLDQHHSEALYYLGKAYEAKKNKESAIAAYVQWIDLEHTNINMMPQESQLQFNDICRYVADYLRANNEIAKSDQIISLLIENGLKEQSDGADTTSFTIDD